ncbi:hypothetical protein ABK040_009287 [Willaertia magna]
MKIIDLSYTFGEGMPLYSSSVKPPQISPVFTHEQSKQLGYYENTTCEVHNVTFNASTGTHLDAPFHFHPSKAKLDQIPIENLVLRGHIIDCRDFVKEGTPIPTTIFDNVDLEELKGKALILFTGFNDKYYGTEKYLKDYPFINQELADLLVKAQISILAVDTLVVDSFLDKKRPAHTTLLKNDILIVEEMCNVEKLWNEMKETVKKFYFHAPVLKFKDAAAFPVRAYATILEQSDLL